MRILAEAPITLLAPIRGRICISPDGSDPQWISPGDVAVTRGPDHYSVADNPSSETSVVIHPGQECQSPDGRSVHDEMMHGIRTWGNDPNGSTLFLVGAYDSIEEVSQRLVHLLPPVFSLQEGEWDNTLVKVLNEEMAKEEPGQAALLDRMVDLLLIAALKAWMVKPKGDLESIESQNDPLVAKALKLMREAPAHPWTVELLARGAGVSRSVLSRRFHSVVGESRMAFLTNWRMALAADWICEPDATVSNVADRLGYSTPFAFSTAFKRIRGMSPKKHREQTLSPSA